MKKAFATCHFSIILVSGSGCARLQIFLAQASISQSQKVFQLKITTSFIVGQRQT